MALSNKAQESRVRINKLEMALLEGLHQAIKDNGNYTYAEINKAFVRMLDNNVSEELKEERKNEEA